MFRPFMIVSTACALAAGLWVLPHASHAAEQGIMSAEEIAYKLAPKRGLRITATQPTSVDLPTVTFEFNSYRLTPQAERQLDELGKALSMEAFKDSRFVIAGHTDAVGSDSYNQKLSQQRAETVVEFLVLMHRLDSRRLSSVGWGETKLLPSVSPEDGANRRVEIQNIGPAE